MTLTSHPFMLANTAQSSTRGNSDHTTQERCAMYAAHTRRVTTTLTHAHPLSAIRCRRSSDKRLRSANNNSTQIRPHTTSRAGPPTGAWGGSGDPAQTKAQILIRLGLDQGLVLIRSAPDQSPVLIGSATGHSLTAEAQYPSDQT